MLERARSELTARFDLDPCDLDELFIERLHVERTASVPVGTWSSPPMRKGTTPRIGQSAAPRRTRTTRDRGPIAFREENLSRFASRPPRPVRHMNLIGGLQAMSAAPVDRAAFGCSRRIMGQHTLPTLNGAPIPITNNAQHTRLTSAGCG